jgi:hypothetical protein
MENTSKSIVLTKIDAVEVFHGVEANERNDEEDDDDDDDDSDMIFGRMNRFVTISEEEPVIFWIMVCQTIICPISMAIREFVMSLWKQRVDDGMQCTRD